MTNAEFLSAPSSFSPDGRKLAFIEVIPDSGRDIWILDLANGKPEAFLRTRYEERAPAFSPDGRWIAYSSDETGQREVYLKSYPDPGGNIQVSTGGGQEPVWNPRGHELFFRSGNKMMAVSLDTSSGMPAETPYMLFEGDYLASGFSFPYYDVS